MELLLGGHGWIVGDDAHAGGVEEEGFDFGFGASSRDFLSVKEEGDAGGVADAGDDLAIGFDGSVGGSDEGFLAGDLTVGGDGDPGSFSGADDEFEGGRSCVGCFGRRLLEVVDGDVAGFGALGRGCGGRGAGCCRRW